MRLGLSKKISAVLLSAVMMFSFAGGRSLADQKDTYKDNNVSYQDRLDSNYLKKVSSVKYIYGSNRYKTAVDVSKAGWPNGSDTVVLVNGKDPIYGIISTPLATSYNAPILITDSNNIAKYIIDEFKRLNPKKVIIVGRRSLVDKNISNIVRNATNADIDRIYGKNPSEISMYIASHINSMHKLSTAYVVSTVNGVVDALTISSKAGEDKSPIIVTNSNSIENKALDFLRNNIDTVYYIGGKNSISGSLVSKISKDIKNAGEANRIDGKNRHVTNVNVINRFYPQSELPSVVVTKSDNIGLIDTVCAGPFSTLKKAPVVITEKNILPDVTKAMLAKKKTDVIYQIGGGISQSVTNKIVSELSIVESDESENKNNIDTNNPTNNDTDNAEETVVENVPQSLRGGIKGKKIVIDAGHGGKDTGSVGVYSIREKDWTLKTALSCADVLRKAGANVIMTRTGDTYPTLQDRADISNSSGAAFFCSIHYNQGGNVINKEEREYSGTGAEVYKSDNDFSNLAAKKILNNIVSNFDLKNRGVKNGTHLFVIRNTDAPSILIEGGFVSSKHDAGILNNDSGLAKMGREIANGIIAAFEAYK